MTWNYFCNTMNVAWNNRQSVSWPVFQSLIVSLVLSRLDYGNAILASISSYPLKRFQSVMNSATQLVFSSSRSDHITPLLYQLYWLKAPERIQFKLAVLTCSCIHRTAPTYLADELLQPADLGIRTRLQLELTTSLSGHRTRLSTVDDRAFPVATARTSNDLPRHVTSASPSPCFPKPSEDAPYPAFFSVTFVNACQMTF